MNSSVTIYEERIPEIAVSVTDLPLFRIQTFDPVTVPRVQKGIVFDWVRFHFCPLSGQVYLPAILPSSFKAP